MTRPAPCRLQNPGFPGPGFWVPRRVILLALLVIGPFLWYSCLSSSPENGAAPAVAAPDLAQELPWVSARLGEVQLRVMIARTDQEKRTGLMFRRTLAPDEGMLFVYDTPHQMTFWMKNTVLPLDLIFFGPDLAVTESIEGMVPGIGIPDEQLPRYTSTRPAQFALEMASGSVSRLGITPGLTLEIPLTLLHTGD